MKKLEKGQNEAAMIFRDGLKELGFISPMILRAINNLY